LRYVQKSVTDDDNCKLNAHPTKNEIKNVVFALNGDSASVPHGFTGHFYQQFWDTVSDDVVKVVDAFFSGATLPKSITHTNLVLLPKKEDIQSFSDLKTN